jgi:uroporphyrin-3 C-methyltransferase
VNNDDPNHADDPSENEAAMETRPDGEGPKKSAEAAAPASESRARSEPEKPRRRGSFLSFLALILALAAAGGTAWMWWQDASSVGQEEQRMMSEISRLEGSDSTLRLQLEQLRERLQSMPAGASGADLEALERRLETDLGRVEALERSLEEQLTLSRSLQLAGEALQRRLAAAEAALSGLATRQLDAGGDLDLAEVDYLMRLANERLKLFHDPVAADEALHVADQHLAAMQDPIYLSVRQDIAAARQELAAIDAPDYLAVTSELDSVQQAIADLPFKGDEPATVGAAPPQAEGWWSKLKSALAGLVTVRRSTELEAQRISLEDKDYVRQRLWLQLEIAHLALMRRDQKAFRHALDRVGETLVLWFDEGSAAYRGITQRIDDLAAQPIDAAMPDISKPWRTLRELRQDRGQPPAGAPPAASTATADEETPPEAADG